MNLRNLTIIIGVIILFAALTPTDIATAYDQTVYQIQKKLADLGYNPGTQLNCETLPLKHSLYEAGKITQTERPTTAGALKKVGFIDLQRLVNESKMGQAAQRDLQKVRQQKEALVAAKLREVNELRELIDKEGDKMSPRQKHDKQLALQKLNKVHQRLVSDVKEDILREDRVLVSIILQKADGVLKEVAKRLNYTIILKDASVIGYLDPKVDITDEVIKELNKK